MALETHPFDATRYFGTPESQAELLADAFETGEARYIADALGTVARIRGMAALAEQVGVPQDGDPSLSTLVEVARALGFRLTVEPVAAE